MARCLDTVNLTFSDLVFPRTKHWDESYHRMPIVKEVSP